MKSVIEDIYLGRRGDTDTIEPSEEYWKVHKEVGKQYEALESQLNEEQKRMLEELYLTMGGLECEQGSTHFKEGFKLGLLVAIEAFV